MMVRWQYHRVRGGVTWQRLEELGFLGWELIGEIDGGRWLYFKRPIDPLTNPR